MNNLWLVAFYKDGKIQYGKLKILEEFPHKYKVDSVFPFDEYQYMCKCNIGKPFKKESAYYAVCRDIQEVERLIYGYFNTKKDSWYVQMKELEEKDKSNNASFFNKNDIKTYDIKDLHNKTLKIQVIEDDGYRVISGTDINNGNIYIIDYPGANEKYNCGCGGDALFKISIMNNDVYMCDKCLGKLGKCIIEALV